MKLNWRVLVASVLVFGSIFWAVESVRSRSYSGANLKFVVGRGAVTVTNPSSEPVAVQLVGAGSRSFSVSSTIEGMSGSPTKQGSGSPATQVFEFELPPGISEFTVARSTNATTNLNFVANTDTRLEATAHPLNASDFRTTLIATVVVVLGALFYISRTTNHRWINTLRRQEISIPNLKPIPVSAAGGQGGALRPYGDNRADISN